MCKMKWKKDMHFIDKEESKWRERERVPTWDIWWLAGLGFHILYIVSSHHSLCTLVSTLFLYGVQGCTYYTKDFFFINLSYILLGILILTSWFLLWHLVFVVKYLCTWELYYIFDIGTCILKNFCEIKSWVVGYMGIKWSYLV